MTNHIVIIFQGYTKLKTILRNETYEDRMPKDKVPAFPGALDTYTHVAPSIETAFDGHLKVVKLTHNFNPSIHLFWHKSARNTWWCWIKVYDNVQSKYNVTDKHNTQKKSVEMLENLISWFTSPFTLRNFSVEKYTFCNCLDGHNESFLIRWCRIMWVYYWLVSRTISATTTLSGVIHLV